MKNQFNTFSKKHDFNVFSQQLLREIHGFYIQRKDLENSYAFWKTEGNN